MIQDLFVLSSHSRDGQVTLTRKELRIAVSIAHMDPEFDAYAPAPRKMRNPVSYARCLNRVLERPIAECAIISAVIREDPLPDDIMSASAASPPRA